MSDQGISDLLLEGCVPFAMQFARLGWRFLTDFPGLSPFAESWLQAQLAFLRLAGSGLMAQPTAGGTERFLADQYRQLFAMPGLISAMPPVATPGRGQARYQRAAERFGTLLGEVALDAARRLGAALAEDGPDVVPIATLRELHALWIECGEAAWSAAAHREDFAAAQAELVAALVTLRASAGAA